MDKIPGVKILLYKNTEGWIRACNNLMESTTTDILLMNDDCIATSNLVLEMQTLTYSNNLIGIVGGKSIDPTGSFITNFGIYVDKTGNTANKHYGQPLDSVGIEYQKAVEGSCFFIKRELIDKIGYFDLGYEPAYREEVDYCFRAREAGYKVVSCPTASYIHYSSATMSRLGITNDTYDYFMSKWGTKLKLGLV